MPTFSEEIFILAMQHEHFRSRLGASIANDAARILDGIYSESRNELLTNIESLRESLGDDSTRTNARFRAQLRDVVANIAAIRAGSFDESISLAQQQLVEFSEYEAEFTQQRIFNQAAENVLEGTPITLAFEGITPISLYAATMTSRVALGSGLNGTLNSLLEGIPQSEQRRMFDSIERGFALGQTNQQIIRNVFNNQSGAAQASKSRQAIESLVRTATNSMGQQAHRLIAEQNDDLIRGYRNLPVYDSRISAICASIALQFGDRVLPNYSDFPPIPRHLRCRSQIISVLKPWNEVLNTGRVQIKDDQGTQSFFAAPRAESSAQLTSRLRAEGLTPAQIATFKTNISGQTSSTTLSGFLGEQRSRGNRDFLNTFFRSPERAQLYIDGQVPARDLFSSENRAPIPLTTLRERQL